MCNLYSVTKSQTAIIEAARAMRDTTSNLSPMPSIFPDYPAPIVRNAPDGVRELTLARWGDALSPSVRKRASHEHSQHEKCALAAMACAPEPLRCAMDQLLRVRGYKAEKDADLFAFGEDRPLAFFAGLGSAWCGVRVTKANSVEGEQGDDQGMKLAFRGIWSAGLRANVARIHVCSGLSTSS